LKYVKWTLYGFAALAVTALAVISIVLLLTPAAPAVIAADAVVVKTSATTVLTMVAVSCGVAAVAGFVSGRLVSKRYETICEASKTAGEIKELMQNLYNDAIKVDNLINELNGEFEHQESLFGNIENGMNNNHFNSVHQMALNEIKTSIEEFVNQCENIKTTIQDAKQKYIAMNANSKQE